MSRLAAFVLEPTLGSALSKGAQGMCGAVLGAGLAMASQALAGAMVGEYDYDAKPASLVSPRQV